MMSRTAVLAPLALLLAVSSARAGSERRERELQDKLKEILPRLSEQEANYLTTGLNNYLDARKRTLEQLLGIVDDGSTGNLEQEKKWVEVVKTLRDNALRTFGDCLDSVRETSREADLFLALTVVEEDKFWGTIETLGVAARRDFIIQNQIKIDEKIKILDEKWNSMKSQDDSIDEEERKVLDELEEIMKKSVEREATWRQSAKEILARISTSLDKFRKIKDVLPEQIRSIAQGVLAINEPIAEYCKWWLNMTDPIATRTYHFRRLVESERGGVFFLFTQTRLDTEEFIKTNGFDQAKAAWQAAQDTCNRLATDLITPGQKDDGGSFGKDVIEKLSKHLSLNEQKFNEFVSRHKGKFFGPLSPDIKQALCETQQWEKEVGDILTADLDSKLRVWRSEANTFLCVDTSELATAAREEVESQLRPRIAELVTAMEAAERAVERGRLKEALSRADADRVLE